MSHAELKKAANDAIENLFSDTSVSKVRTRKDMEDLRDSIITNIQMITTDIQNARADGEEDEAEEDEE